MEVSRRGITLLRAATERAANGTWFREAGGGGGLRFEEYRGVNERACVCVCVVCVCEQQLSNAKMPLICAGTLRRGSLSQTYDFKLTLHLALPRFPPPHRGVVLCFPCSTPGMISMTRWYVQAAAEGVTRTPGPSLLRTCSFIAEWCSIRTNRTSRTRRALNKTRTVDSVSYTNHTRQCIIVHHTKRSVYRLATLTVIEEKLHESNRAL